jgi:hypothetical protein
VPPWSGVAEAWQLERLDVPRGAFYWQAEAGLPISIPAPQSAHASV